MAEAAKTAQQKAVDASEPSPAPQPAPEQESVSAVPPAQSNGHPGGAVEASPDTIAEPTSDPPDSTAPEAAAAPADPAAQHDDRNPVADDREQILAAFARNRTPPQPAKPPAPQPRPAVRQAGPAEPEFSDAAWDEFCAGFRFGTLKWNTRRLGPEPFQPGCRAPKHILKRNGLA
jgi:hypothetical protein